MINQHSLFAIYNKPMFISHIQDSSNFYLLVSSKAGSGQGPWQLKRVKSSTGPVGTSLADACRKPYSVSGQTEMLWIATSRRNSDQESIKKNFDDIYNPNEDTDSNNDNRLSRSSYGM